MSDTPTDNLSLRKPEVGQNQNTWGGLLNGSIDLIDEAVAGVLSFTLSGSKTLTSTAMATNEARHAVLNITAGTGGTVTVPGVEKVYAVRNNTSGTVTITAGNTGATVRAGNGQFVFCNGTDVYALAVTDFGSSAVSSSATPSTGNHLTNKTYVDAEVAGVVADANAAAIGYANAAEASATAAAASETAAGVSEAAAAASASAADASADAAAVSAAAADASADAAAASAAAAEGMPVGGIAPFAGDPGSGWLKCDGSSYLQSAYPALYAKVGLQISPSWTARTPSSTASPNFVGAPNGNFVILHGGGVGQYSTDDGATWSALTASLSTNTLNSMVWTGTKYVVSSNNNGLSNNTVLTTAFTARTSAFAAGTNIQNIASNGAGVVVAAGNYTSQIRVQYSTDNGDTWTLGTLPHTNNASPSGLIYAGGKFVLVTQQSSTVTYIYSSTDGINWTTRLTVNDGIARYPYYFGGAFYVARAVASGRPEVYKSTDGETWSLLPGRPFSLNANGLAGISSPRLVATGPGGIALMNNSSATSIYYIGEDFRLTSWIAPPNTTLQNSRGMAANTTTMVLFTSDGSSTATLHTSPLYAYDEATEFVVPELAAPDGAPALSYYIKAA